MYKLPQFFFFFFLLDKTNETKYAFIFRAQDILNFRVKYLMLYNGCCINPWERETASSCGYESLLMWNVITHAGAWQQYEWVWSSGAVCLNDAKYDDEKLCGAGYMQHYTMTYVHISWKKTASICEKWQNTGGYYRLLRPGVTSWRPPEIHE